MRPTALNTIYSIAQQDSRVAFIGSDIGVGVLDDFKKSMPDRFFVEGISEAHVVGMAAGMAMEGYIPYVNTIATFLTRRCFEQIVLDLALHHLPVRLVANGGGVVYAPLGPTHLAIDDIAILRTVPNMTVIAPADPIEMERALRATVDHPGPIYFRIAKGGEPKITGDNAPFALDRVFPMREGDDAVIFTTGITLHEALKASDLLKSCGVECAVVHVPTVKPFPEKAVLAAALATPVVITMEEGTKIGGLGSAVAELLAENSPGAVRFRRLGLPDEFPHHYGSQADHLRHNGLDAQSVVNVVLELVQGRTEKATAKTAVYALK